MATHGATAADEVRSAVLPSIQSPQHSLPQRGSIVSVPRRFSHTTTLPPIRPVKNALLGEPGEALSFSDHTTAQKHRAALPADLLLQPLVFNISSHNFVCILV